MKKLIILLFVMILLLTSCSNINNILSNSESEKIKQMSTDILTCITENDKESFKNLFCERSQNIPGFDEQVDAMFEYCNGTVCFTDSTIKTTASGGSSTQKGERVEWHVSPEIPYFEVLSEPDPDEEQSTYFSVMKSRYYSIRYSWYITYESDKAVEGLHGLKIELLNVDSMTVGEWISLFD